MPYIWDEMSIYSEWQELLFTEIIMNNSDCYSKKAQQIDIKRFKAEDFYEK